MSVVVKNVGPLGIGANNAKNTDLRASFGDQGTVRVVIHNIEYVWGPNESKTMEDGLGHRAVAADSRLRFVDTRDASVIGNPSITLRT
jgi:hypothetical protein